MINLYHSLIGYYYKWLTNNTFGYEWFIKGGNNEQHRNLTGQQ